MNRYSSIFMIGPRGCGHTTAIVNACKEIGAKMICANQQDAVHIKRLYKIDTVSLNAHFPSGPYLMDHFAMQQVCLNYEAEINQLAADNKQLSEDLRQIRSRLDNPPPHAAAEADPVSPVEQPQIAPDE